MRVLVTGGNGFIGRNVVYALVSGGHEVIVVDDCSNSKFNRESWLWKYREEGAPVTVRLKDFTTVDLAEYAPHAVIHLAGQKSVLDSASYPDHYWGENVQKTIRLARAAMEANVEMFVYSSSASVYGDSLDRVMEDDVPNPQSVYGHTKLAAERYLEAISPVSPMKVRVARYFNVVGGGCSNQLGDEGRDRDATLFGRILQVARGEKNALEIRGKNFVTSDGTALRDFIHVADLADAHRLLVEDRSSPPYEVLNIGTGHLKTVLKVVQEFRDQGCRVPVKYVDAVPGELGRSGADVSKMLRLYGWVPKKGLGAMVQSAIEFDKISTVLPRKADKRLEKLYEIWAEGYAATGESGRAQLMGTVYAKTFQEACDKLAAESPRFRKNYDAKRLTHWGCQLFALESDARKSFG